MLKDVGKHKGSWTMPTLEECKSIIYEMFPGSWVRSPFQIRNYATYRVREREPWQMMNPCGEIAIGKPEWMWFVRPLFSPFQMEDFREPYYVIPGVEPDGY